MSKASFSKGHTLLICNWYILQDLWSSVLSRSADVTDTVGANRHERYRTEQRGIWHLNCKEHHVCVKREDTEDVHFFVSKHANCSLRLRSFGLLLDVFIYIWFI
jgi:hypothetical protein